MFFKFIKFSIYFFFISLFQNKLFAQKIVWKQIQIPAEGTNSNGLETLIMWPETKGKHPLSLITHGTPRNHEEIPKRSAMLFFAQAMEFARRGFGVAVVMRKGFGHSGGGLSRYLNDSCTSPPYLLRTKQASDDLKKAISYLSSMPQFDTSKTIVIGVFTGRALTAFPLEPKDSVVVAGINFAGGSGSYSNGRICGLKN